MNDNIDDVKSADALAEGGLDDFDLDLDSDDFDFGGEEEEEHIPKSRVKDIVRKRLARERNKVKSLYDQFKEVYGMGPEEVIEYGRRAVMEQQGFVPEQPAAAVGDAVQQPPVDAADPILSKISELEARQRELEEARQREREAMEFLQKFPNVKLSDIPPEVIRRRAQGGVTLAEAYKLYIADKEVEDAAKRAAEETAKNIRTRQKARAEGADYTGGAGDDSTGSLTEEERMFARMYGMTPKQYAAYKSRIAKMREEEY